MQLNPGLNAEKAPPSPDARPACQIVVVDWNVTRMSPAGSTILAIVSGLHTRFRFHVVAAYFENPSPETVEHLRVPLPRAPSFVKELFWPYMVGLVFRWRQQRGRSQALTWATQGQLPGAKLVSAHFCHLAYLRDQFPKSRTRGLRRLSRILVHRHGAHLESRAFQLADVVVVPSKGLAEELARTYPFVRDKLTRIPNPVDVGSFVHGPTFDRAGARVQLEFPPDAVVFAFVALGDFARKGLEVAILALARLQSRQARLLVVGGNSREISTFQTIAARADVADQVRFVGLQPDVRTFLWLSDVFVLPSAYEAFPLVTLQAAAAGLPLIVPPDVHGSSEFLQHGINGWFAARTIDDVAAAMRTAVESSSELPEMGRRARRAVEPFDSRFFVERWGQLFERLLREPS